MKLLNMKEFFFESEEMVRNPMKGAIIFLIKVLSFQFFYKTLGRIHINLFALIYSNYWTKPEKDNNWIGRLSWPNVVKT